MPLKKWELEADEFFAERTVYILQQTVQKLSGAVHLKRLVFPIRIERATRGLGMEERYY
jgi:hypothetical protein